MAQLKLSKLNIIDVAAVVVVLLVIAMGAIYYLQKPKSVDTKLIVTVHVGDPIISKAILSQAQADKSVFLNSVDKPLDVQVVKGAFDATGQLNALDIMLEGPGYIDKNNNYIFNGQRVLINQKAEIHGNYFAAGAITKVENAK